MDIDGIRIPGPKRTRRTKTNDTVVGGRFQAVQEIVEVRQTPQVTSIKRFPLPDYYAPERPLRPTRKRFIRKANVLRFASVCMVLVIAVGGFLSWQAYLNLHRVFRGSGTVAALTGKPIAPSLLKGEGDGRVNILLLGIGGPGHDGPDLTDTIVILSVDPVNNTATMLSVPRDIWVKQPVNYFGASQKINAVYESGKYKALGKMDASNSNANAVEAGFTAEDQIMQTVLGLKIHYHMLVNFQAFRQAIDTVGGVTVDVKTPLIDPTMAWENNRNSTLAPAGIQQMDGTKALLFARSRETSSDFARADRQRQLMMALKDKVLNAGTISNPTKIDGLMNAFGDNVYSDLSTQGASRLYSIIKNVNDSKITSVGLGDQGQELLTTDHVGNISVVRPLAGLDSYDAIHMYVRSVLLDGYLIKERAGVAVIGKTATEAAETATTLKSYGYNVTTVMTNVAVGSQPMIVDLSRGKDPYTKHYLEERYNLRVSTALPAGLNLADQSTKFVIIDK